MAVGIVLLSMLLSGAAAIALMVFNDASWTAGLLVFGVGGSGIALLSAAIRAFVIDIKRQNDERPGTDPFARSKQDR